MGLPESVGTGISEFIMGANTSLSLTVLLTRGSAHLIESFGTDELKAIYCEKMYSGEWAGTMCLTEPSAGSDLGDIKTKAVKQEDGSYLIEGEKIFITSGDHDLTPNIVHAVLARTPEAPTGPKGLSLFVVPKFRVNAGRLPRRAQRRGLRRHRAQARHPRLPHLQPGLRQQRRLPGLPPRPGARRASSSCSR